MKNNRNTYSNRHQSPKGSAKSHQNVMQSYVQSPGRVPYLNNRTTFSHNGSSPDISENFSRGSSQDNDRGSVQFNVKNYNKTVSYQHKEINIKTDSSNKSKAKEVFDPSNVRNNKHKSQAQNANSNSYRDIKAQEQIDSTYYPNYGSTYTQKIKNLQNAFKEIRGQPNEVIPTHKHQKANNSRTETENSALGDDYASQKEWKVKFSIMEEENLKLHNLLRHKDKEIEKLNNSMDMLTNALNKFEANEKYFENESLSLQTEYEKNFNLCKKMEFQLLEKDKIINDINGTYMAIDEKYQDLLKNNDQREKEVNSLNQRLKKKQEEVSLLIKDSQINEKFSSEIKNLKIENSELKQKLANSKMELEFIQKEMISLQNDIINQSENNEANEQNEANGLPGKVLEILDFLYSGDDSWQNQIDVITDMISKWKAFCNKEVISLNLYPIEMLIQVHTNLKGTNDNFDCLQREFQGMESKFIEIFEQNEKLNSALLKKSEEIEYLTRNVKPATVLGVICETQEEDEEYLSRCNSKERELDSNPISNREINKNNSELEELRANANSRYQELNERLDHVNSDRKRLEEKNTELTELNRTLEMSLLMSQDEIARLEDENSKIQELSRNQEEIDFSINSKDQTIRDLSQTNSRLSSEISYLKSMSVNSNEENKKLYEALNQRKTEIDSLKNKIVELLQLKEKEVLSTSKHEKAIPNNSTQEMKLRLSSNIDRIRELEREIFQLKDDVSEMIRQKTRFENLYNEERQELSEKRKNYLELNEKYLEAIGVINRLERNFIEDFDEEMKEIDKLDEY